MSLFSKKPVEVAYPTISGDTGPVLAASPAPTAECDIRHHPSANVWKWRARVNWAATTLIPVSAEGESPSKAQAAELAENAGRELLRAQLEYAEPWTEVAVITADDL